MGYNTKKKQIEVPPISIKKELFSIRDEIQKNIQHRGRNFEIVLEAYTQIQIFYGHPVPSSKLCTSGCIKQMNKILINWFKAYDKCGGKTSEPKKGTQKPKEKEYTIEEALNIDSSDSLIPLQYRREALEKSNFYDIKEKALEMFGEDKLNEWSGGKLISKKVLIDKILGV